MSTEAFMGGIVFKMASGGSPEYMNLPEVFSLSGLGKTNSLVDATNFDSGKTKEYIAGMADGQEITVECNYLPKNSAQTAFRTAVNDGLTKGFKLTITDPGHSPIRSETFSFNGVCLSWALNPSQEEKHTMSFTVKISGDVTIT